MTHEHFQGSWALVTGASRGIGREAAIALANAGVNVVVQSRTMVGTAQLLEILESAGVQAFAVDAELSEPKSVQRMADEVAERAPISMIFNNAAIQPKSADPYWAVDPRAWATCLSVNVIAPMIVIERLLPGMLERGYGRITNTTSGIIHQPEQAAYAGSKGAINKITLDLAQRLKGTGVAVNVLDPGWIRTDMGGPNAPNSVATTVPGSIVGGFVDDAVTGCWLNAQDFTGMSLDDAIAAAPAKALRLAVTAPTVAE